MQTQTRLINRSAVRDFTFAVLADKRPHLVAKITRVSDDYYQLRNSIVEHIDHLSTVGATIR